MLLEFKTKNYKSFVNEAVFSMTAKPKQKGLDYSLCKAKVKGSKKIIKGLCSSVIYGLNASGKTNIIGAMDTFRAIVLRGNIKNAEESGMPNVAAYSLELIPNTQYADPEPVDFSVDFYENNMRIQYSVSLNLGTFMNAEYDRRVISEKLLVNGNIIFDRDTNLEIDNLNVIKDYISPSFKTNFNEVKDIAFNSLNDDELFLTNGFKLIFSKTFVELITNWFANKFMVVYRADSIQLIKRFSDPKKNGIYIENTINKAAKLFGINSNALGYIVNDDESEAKLCSIFKNSNNQASAAITADIFESYGTIRFINIFPLVLRAIITGGTLVVDEFDASIHPMALMSIINVFHNDDININHAQLIFNTHNPIFLNSNLFRRDEIKFVERDDENHHSNFYSLADFGTTGEQGVRKHEDYMKNYFISQYGAIKDIDFSSIFEDIITSESESELQRK